MSTTGHLIVLRGVPASGKSTWAAEFVAADPSKRARVSRDGFRAMLAGDDSASTGPFESEVTVMQEQAVTSMLQAGHTVVLDDTNIPAKRVRSWLGLAERLGASWDVKEFEVPLDECLRRNAARARVVPEEVVRDMHAKLSKSLKGGNRNWSPLHPKSGAKPAGAPYQGTPDAAAAVLVDIDGTVALMDGRSPFDWSRVGEDLVNQPVVDYVRMLHDQGFRIVFLSGRSDECRRDTEQWLAEHVGVPYARLFMRAAGDYRKDSFVKLDLFDKHVRDNWDVHSVVDDRAQVVEMWRSLGLTVLQVAEGDF